MKRLSWILALVFGLVFVGATVLNAALVAKARGALLGLPAGESSEPRQYHLALILPDNDDSLFTGIRQGVSTEAGASAIAVQFFRYNAQSAQEADRCFQIAIRSRLDGIVMYAPRSGGVAGRASEAARRGVVYIPVGTDAPADEEGPFIGSGSRLQGATGGQLICKRLAGSARLGVVLLATGAGKPEEEPLFLGLQASLRGYPGARVVDLAEAGTGILAGEAVVESMLREHPEINAILCSSARDTVGAGQVLVDLNKVGSILIIGADETEDIKRYLDKGVVAASVVRDSKRIGVEAVRAFAREKRGEGEPEPKEAGFFVVEGKAPKR